MKDTVLIKELKDGGRDSFDQIYRKYHYQLVRFALKYVKSSQLAEDAVQDVFIKLWQYRQNLDENQSLKSFLYTSSKNHILNLIRDSHQEIYEAYEPQASTVNNRNKVEEDLIYQEYEQVIERAIELLSEKRRLVFELKRNSDLSNEQIAAKLGVSVHTVKSQYYRGTKIVKDYLRRHSKIFENYDL